MQLTDGTNSVAIGNVYLGTTGADAINSSALLTSQLLYGFAGNDTITGGSGADTIVGGTGADTMTGGAGADTFIINAAESNVTVGGTANTGTISGYDVVTDFDITADFLKLAGSPYVPANATVNGSNSTLTSGGNTISSHKITNGMITFSTANTFSTAITITSVAQVAAVTQYLENNDLGNAGATVAFTATISGTAHTYIYEQVGATPSVANDILVDLQGANATVSNLSTLLTNGHISGTDDFINSTASAETLSGGAGVDTVSYSLAASGVTVDLSSVAAQVTGGGGTDTLSGFENLTGSAYADTLTGDANANVIIGGAGADTIIGGGGADTLYGGTGADTFKYNATSDGGTGGVGNDVIKDFSVADGDRVDLTSILNSSAAVHSTISIDQIASTDSVSTITVDIGGTTYTMAALNGVEAGVPDILANSHSSANLTTALGGASWTDIVDVSSTHSGGPSAISADAATASMTNSYTANPAGDWTVQIKSGTATVDAVTKQITFSTDHATNEVVITTADGTAHDIKNVDVIQWH